MFEKFLSERTIKMLILAIIIACVAAIYFFFDNIFYSSSYQTVDATGIVFRKITMPYSFKINLIGLVYGIIMLLSLLLLWIYLFAGNEKRELEKKIFAKAIDIDRSDLSSDSNVFYGKGRIDQEATSEFVKEHNESAVKFLFHKNLDGSPLDRTLRSLHREWSSRGMTDEMVMAEILDLLEKDEIDDSNLYELLLDLREKTKGISKTEDFL